MSETPETDAAEFYYDGRTGFVEIDFCRKLERERDEAMRALEWIAGAYCHEKTTFQLAQEAYEMSSKARWTLQKIEKKEEA